MFMCGCPSCKLVKIINIACTYILRCSQLTLYNSKWHKGTVYRAFLNLCATCCCPAVISCIPPPPPSKKGLGMRLSSV